MLSRMESFGLKEITEYFTSNFKDLFQSSNSIITDKLEVLGMKEVTDLENTMLINIPTATKIYDCIKKLHPLKSLGPDGYPCIFFRTYWNTVKDSVVNFTQECFLLQHMPHGINQTFIVIVPKVNNPAHFNQFRPISLCNFMYKIISKILTERMRWLLGKIISPNQGAFIEDQWIAENTVIAQKIIHKVKKHRGRNGLMVVKVDLVKAYDRIEWHFLDWALAAWGFSEDVRKLIHSYVSTVEFSVLINGGVSETFTPQRGLHQGDALSPYLFIIYVEFLTRMLGVQEEK